MLAPLFHYCSTPAYSQDLLGVPDVTLTSLLATLKKSPPNAHKKAQAQAWINAMKPYWKALGLEDHASSLLKHLKKTNCCIILCGQQPSLFGGPVMHSTKLASSLALARTLRQHGCSAITLFWVHDDDHSTEALFPGDFLAQPNPTTITHTHAPTPLYEHRLSAHQSLRLDTLSSYLKSSPYADKTLPLFQSVAKRSNTPSEEFVHLLYALHQDNMWLPIFPRAFRLLQQPLLTHLLSHLNTYHSILKHTIHHHNTHNIPTPIPTPHPTPFYYINKRKRRIRLPHSHVNQDTLLHNASPDALSRVLVQDAIIKPNICILGHHELCYTLELNQLKNQWKLHKPILLPRPTLTLKTARTTPMLTERNRNILDVFAWHGPTALTEASSLIQHHCSLWNGPTLTWNLQS